MVGTLWLPRSDCDPRCLPPKATVPGVGPIRVTCRMLAVFAVVAGAVATLPWLMALPWLRLPAARRAGSMGGAGSARGARAMGVFARALLTALGVGHLATGRLPQRGALVVANHMSWLDVVVLFAHTPARLMAKREVRDWPVIGWLASAAGSLFLDRSEPRALPGTVGGVAEALRAGAVVAVFPEGTTWCGRAAGPFRPAMFQAAIDAAVPVVPVTLRFQLADGSGTTVAAYIGEDTLWSSVVRVARTRGLRVRLHAHPALHPADGASRRTLARAAAQLAHEGGPAHEGGLASDRPAPGRRGPARLVPGRRQWAGG
jgi:1-acyl-sn-glycerol-3-phosphate acyltransferase